MVFGNQSAALLSSMYSTYASLYALLGVLHPTLSNSFSANRPVITICSPSMARPWAASWFAVPNWKTQSFWNALMLAKNLSCATKPSQSPDEYPSSLVNVSFFMSPPVAPATYT